ncbi:hypothetical protein [Streptomyces violascens]|uniref:hypothetical protein n=1 Tax=Streptomyces violascens TaxID=67381 RepID=UPI00368CCCAA
MFEHKRDAYSNVTSYGAFQGRRRFNDAVAQTLTTPEYTPGLHTPEECRGCEAHWHTGLRNGRWAAGMPQIDFYRSTPDRWVRPLKVGGGSVHLPDPTEVLRVLLDRTAYEHAMNDRAVSTGAEYIGRVLEMVVYP